MNIKPEQENFHPALLSRDYVIGHEKLGILSRDEVTAQGIFWDDGELCGDESGYLIVNRDGIPFTGLIYEVYDHKNMGSYPFFNTDFQDGTLLDYTYYADGLQDGADVEFYPSGAVQKYSVCRKGKVIGRSYEWYENGMIKILRDYSDNSGHYLYTEFNKQGKITRQYKV